MSERVRPDLLVDPGPSGDASHDPTGGVSIQALTVRPEEDRPVQPLTDPQIDRPRGPRRERDRDDLAALAQDRERPPRCRSGWQRPHSQKDAELILGGIWPTKVPLA